MGNKTRLDKDQQAWLTEQMEDAVFAGTPPETAALADAVGARLLRLAEGGDAWAQDAVEALALDGMEERTYAFLKRDRTVIPVPAPAVTPAGAPARTKQTPSRAGTPQRDEAGSVYWQQKLWWELTWEQFALLLGRMRQQIARMEERERGLATVLALQERHPESRTPGEACALEDIDPRSLGLHELAG